jgi:hypothetical protein
VPRPRDAATSSGLFGETLASLAGQIFRGHGSRFRVTSGSHAPGSRGRLSPEGVRLNELRKEAAGGDKLTRIRTRTCLLERQQMQQCEADYWARVGCVNPVGCVDSIPLQINTF